MKDGVTSRAVHEIDNVTERYSIWLEDTSALRSGRRIDYPHLWFSCDSSKVCFALIGLQSEWNYIFTSITRDGYIDLSEYCENIMFMPDKDDAEIFEIIADNDKDKNKNASPLLKAAYEAAPNSFRR